MPALGMAQDTGLIVAWLKDTGEEVSATDPLMEVETDKATMEVEAGADGTLIELRASEGENVPVGHVVAVIAGAGEDATPVKASTAPPEAPSEPTPAAPPDAAPPSAAPAAAPAPAAPTTAAAAPVRHGERILASPKARRLAAEEGLDLMRLREAGHAEPFHVADLDVLRTLKAPQHAASTGAATAHIDALVRREAFEDFVGFVGQTVASPRLAVLGAFAAAGMRAGGADTVSVRVEQGQRHITLADPDRKRLSAPKAVEDGAPTLIVRDVSATPITGLALSAEGAPTLTVARKGEDLAIALHYRPGTLDDGAAIAVISAFAERLAQPLRHLL
ncbi:MAG: biotin/lipoyl-containing protein [Pseudomonadota bacterium]